jgi:hypothetical protein
MSPEGAEGGSAGAQGGAGKPDAKADESAKIAQELAAAKAELTKYQSEASKKADLEKADQGKAKELLAEKITLLDATNARLAEYEKKEAARVKAQKERVEAMIGELPESVREEVQFVGEGMDPDKLEKFVGMKLKASGITSASAKAPPLGTSAGGGGRGKDPVTPEQEKVMRKAGAKQSAFDMAREGMKGFKREEDGLSMTVYRFKGTGDDETDSQSLIDALRARAFGKTRPTRDEMRGYMGFEK